MNKINVTKGAIFYESLSMNRYLKEVKKTEFLSAEKEAELSDKAMSGDLAAVNELVVANLRFALQVARKYAGMGLDIEDLVAYGNIGLHEAARKFEASKGVKFISFAVWFVRAEITKALNDLSRTVRIPSHRTKTEEYGSFNIDTSLGGEEGKGDSYADRYLTTEKTRSTLEMEDLQTDLRAALGTLKPNQRKAIEMYYCIGYEFNRSMEQIAEDMNVTRERVRQLIRQGEQKLRATGLNVHLY